MTLEFNGEYGDEPCRYCENYDIWDMPFMGGGCSEGNCKITNAQVHLNGRYSKWKSEIPDKCPLKKY